MTLKKTVGIFLLSFIVVACHVGPDYQKPTTPVSTHFKEAKNNVWVVAKPSDLDNRGEWWCIFHDKKLNALEKELNAQDQNIVVARGQYLQALALVDQARAAYFPTFSATESLSYQSNNGQGNSNNSTNPSTQGGNANLNSFRGFQLGATWEADLWGATARNVESTRETAESSAAQLAATMLSDQASLAQYYFELRGVDNDQVFLDKIVRVDEKILASANQKLKEGVFALSNVIQARNTLDTAKQAAENNKINRGLYEHAIAILLGKTPADFSLTPVFARQHAPKVTGVLPSTLLERRPDVAAAERKVAAANAQIGVAKAAYFPVLSFSPTAAWAASDLSHWASWPLFSWSLGPQLTETFFDGGLRNANLRYARVGYDVAVGQYRQTALTAFQNVEDSLAQLRSLNAQSRIANHAATDANTAFILANNQFQEGTFAEPDRDSAELSALTTRQNASDVEALQMTYTVALIKAIGGGFQTANTHQS